MFISDDGVTIHADLGKTLIRGEKTTKVLLETFLEVLRETDEYDWLMKEYNLPRHKNDSFWGVNGHSMDAVSDAIDILDGYAPIENYDQQYYFGTKKYDCTDFGFWPA